MTAQPADAPPADATGPASVAAIMAAIRDEVAAPAKTPDAALDEDDVAPIAGRRAAGAEASRGGADRVAAPDAGIVADAGAEHDTAGASLPPGDAVAAALTPLLQAWLDAHLPEIVERAVAAAIRRLTGEAVDLPPD